MCLNVRDPPRALRIHFQAGQRRTLTAFWPWGRSATSEYTSAPVWALTVRMRSPTVTSDMALEAPDSRVTVSVAAKHPLLLLLPLLLPLPLATLPLLLLVLLVLLGTSTVYNTLVPASRRRPCVAE